MSKSERAGKRDEDHDEGLAPQTTRGQIFFGRGERDEVVGGDERINVVGEGGSLRGVGVGGGSQRRAKRVSLQVFLLY